ncbi:MAG: cysteine desulfurase [Methanothrix sp.]
MNVQEIRSDFPILDDLIYLDSAATSLTPEPVLEAVLGYYRSYRANVGRGVYRQAQIADQRYREAHRKVAGFVGGEDGTAVFTRNATESINLVAGGLDWKRGDRIVTTLLEHHSNLLPWMRLKEMGVDLVVLAPDRMGRIDLADLERAINKKTRLVAMSHLSNALGTIQPAREVGRICRERGALFLLDAAQSLPHMAVNVKDIDCDFLCFSGHKMLGPTGSGVLWIRELEEGKRNGEQRRAKGQRMSGHASKNQDSGKKPGSIELEPLLVGGGMVEDVLDDGFLIKKGYEGYEAGTPDISAGIGLGAAVDYLARIGIDKVHDHEMSLTRKLLLGLEGIGGLEVYGPGADSPVERGGVVSFGIEGLLPHEIALMLDQASNICIRSGHHCCIPLMRHLGLKHGTARASLYLYNTDEEIEKLLGTLEQIARMA